MEPFTITFFPFQVHWTLVHEGWFGMSTRNSILNLRISRNQQVNWNYFAWRSFESIRISFLCSKCLLKFSNWIHFQREYVYMMESPSPKHRWCAWKRPVAELYRKQDIVVQITNAVRSIYKNKLSVGVWPKYISPHIVSKYFTFNARIYVR